MQRVIYTIKTMTQVSYGTVFLVLTVEVIICELALVGRITIVVDEEFFALIDEAQRPKEYLFGCVGEMVAHVGCIGMVIEATISQHQCAVGFRPFETVAVEDGVFKSGVVAMIDQND